MLSKIDLSLSINNKEFKAEMKQMEKTLSSLQLKIMELKIPVIIIFEGWSAAGKGTLISKVLYPLDPRYFNVYTMNRITEESYMRPYIWSYFTKTPAKGRITILDKSWHRATMPGGNKDWKMKNRERENFFQDINAFEEQLTNDNNVIIKFFLHIGKDEQKKRFTQLTKGSATKWRVNDDDWEQNKNYDKYRTHFENMILQTSTEESPWHVIEATDGNYAANKVYKILIGTIEEKIRKFTAEVKRESVKAPKPLAAPVSILSAVNPRQEISDEDYKKQLQKYQKKIKELGYKLYSKRKSVVIVYEGWDAAGKGGNIKRLTEVLDPRSYEVTPVAAPTAEDLSHHYLWRFWRKYPKDGHVAIFDRSWYGRVMVERIEGFCSAEEWQRAYKEINDMELHFYNHGSVIFKFWLHVDKEEQLRRFTSRQEDPLKQYKITEEDWRNREKWDQYETAVNEMLFRTDTEYAPWVIVESNNKKYARIKVLEYVTKELEKRLNE